MLRWTSAYEAQCAAVWRHAEMHGSRALSRVRVNSNRVCPQLHLAHRLTTGARPDMPGHPGNSRVVTDCELILNITGEGRLEFEDHTLAIHGHQLLFIPPFVPHRFVFSHGVVTDHIAVHFDFIPNMPGVAAEPKNREPYQLEFPPGLSLPEALALPPGSRIQDSLIELVTLAEGQSPALALAAIHYLSGVYLDTVSLARQASEGPYPVTAARVKIKRAIDFIRENLTDSITLDQIAAVADLSPGHLCARFQNETGYSPLEYQRSMRVEQAKTLLGNTDLQIKQIADQLGFQCPFHFSRVFRRTVGVSPAEYRLRHIS